MPLQQRTLDTLHQLLENNFTYYEALGHAGRLKFMRRLLQFIKEKEFRGMDGLEVTSVMKLMVSASAIQLTFGLEEYRMDHFNTIYLYPGAYYSMAGGAWHKGETDVKGNVSFSWEDFRKGYEDPHDRINLGLHEWAHALMLEARISSLGDDLFREYYRRWHSAAIPVIEGIREEYCEVFRPYGATSAEEFFAVSVEVFFEQPEQFRERAPGLFRHMCILLNQFPLAEEEVEEVLEQEAAPGDAELVIRPGGSSLGYFLVAVSAILAVTLIVGLLGEAFLAFIAVSVLVCIALAVVLYQEMRARNSLWFYRHHVEVHNFFGSKTGSFEYEDLASVEVVPYSTKVNVCFNQVSEGRVSHDNYNLLMEVDDIARMNTYLTARQVPVARQMGQGLRRRRRPADEQDDVWDIQG